MSETARMTNRLRVWWDGRHSQNGLAECDTCGKVQPAQDMDEGQPGHWLRGGHDEDGLVLRCRAVVTCLLRDAEINGPRPGGFRSHGVPR